MIKFVFLFFILVKFSLATALQLILTYPFWGHNAHLAHPVVAALVTYIRTFHFNIFISLLFITNNIVAYLYISYNLVTLRSYVVKTDRKKSINEFILY